MVSRAHIVWRVISVAWRSRPRDDRKVSGAQGGIMTTSLMLSQMTPASFSSVIGVTLPQSLQLSREGGPNRSQRGCDGGEGQVSFKGTKVKFSFLFTFSLDFTGLWKEHIMS